MSDKPKKPKVIAKQDQQAPTLFSSYKVPILSGLEQLSYEAKTRALRAKNELGEAAIENRRIGQQLMNIEPILEIDAANREAERIEATANVQNTKLKVENEEKELLLRRAQLDHQIAHAKRAQKQRKEKKKQERDPVKSAFDRLRTSTNSFEDLKKMRAELEKLVEDDFIDKNTADTFYDNIKDDLLNDLYTRK